MFYWVGYCIVKLLGVIYFPCTYLGLENIPKQGSFLLTSNHISNLDPFAIGVCVRRRFGFVAKEELFKSRLVGFVLRQLGAFPIKRDTSDFRAIRETLRRLKKGTPLVIFPEGTRGGVGRDKKNQPGVALIASKSGVPVLPVYVKGTDKSLSPDAKWFKRHPVEIRIGAPIELKKDSSYQEMADEIMERIYSIGVK